MFNWDILTGRLDFYIVQKFEFPSWIIFLGPLEARVCLSMNSFVDSIPFFIVQVKVTPESVDVLIGSRLTIQCVANVTTAKQLPGARFLMSDGKTEWETSSDRRVTVKKIIDLGEVMVWVSCWMLSHHYKMLIKKLHNWQKHTAQAVRVFNRLGN